MSKKPKKPRTSTKQAATSQKSSRAVRVSDVEGSEPKAAETGESTPESASDPAQAAHDDASAAGEIALPLGMTQEPHTPASTAFPVTEPAATEASKPSERPQGPVSSAPVSHAIQYQSLIPPTDDIDVGWGSDGGEDTSTDSNPVLVGVGIPEPKSTEQEPSRSAEPAKTDVSPAPENAGSSSNESAGVSAATTQAESTSSPVSTRPISSASTSKGPASFRSNTPAERGATGAAGLRRPGPISAAPSFTPPPSSRPPAGIHSPTDPVRPSRAPASLRPSVPSGGAESRPSRAPGSPRPATSATPADNRSSHAPHAGVAPTSPTDTPIAPTQPEASPTAPTTAGDAHEQQEHVTDTAHRTAESTTHTAREKDEPHTASAPVASTGTATRTPLVVEPPLTTAVSPSRAPLQSAATHVRNEFAAPAVPVQSTPSSLPPQLRNRGPLWALLWFASVAAAGAGGWIAKPTPRPRPVNCDCTSKVQSAVREAMLQQQRSVEPAPAATPTPSSTVNTSPNEGTGGSDSQSATTISSAATPSSTVPVVVETKSNDRIDVLVKSRPSNVRVWRLGRAIGRTPLVIQIGRGEHRIFEVGGPAVGVRRLSLNGDKTEVTVDLIPPGKAGK